MPRIRVITFDWGDTLAANHGMPYRVTHRRALAALAGDLAAAGARPAADFMERAFAELAEAFRWSVDPVANPDHREVDLTAMGAGWLRGAGADPGSPAGAAMLARFFATISDTVIPFSETLPALTRLKSLGYRIGILSHVPWPGDHCRAWYRRHGLIGCIDFWSLSSEIGWIKPNPRHYAHALAAAGCAADELLHVGDHPLRDVRGGRQAGFRTCLRRTEHLYPEADLDACGADAEVLHLAEVEAAAERLSR